MINKIKIRDLFKRSKILTAIKGEQISVEKISFISNQDMSDYMKIIRLIVKN